MSSLLKNLGVITPLLLSLSLNLSCKEDKNTYRKNSINNKVNSCIGNLEKNFNLNEFVGKTGDKVYFHAYIADLDGDGYFDVYANTSFGPIFYMNKVFWPSTPTGLTIIK
jgi:hypothetical protein